jgi:hypothetical protein
MSYEPRTYRRTVSPGDLVSFEVTVRETDLQISAQRDLSAPAIALVEEARNLLETYIAGHPRFAESYVPLEVEPGAPALVSAMAGAAHIANVGPMAAVAGAVAEHVARGLTADSPEVIVENGGDVYLMGSCDRTLALWAGEGGARGVGILVTARLLPIAVCTSSGRIGHSTSFGAADAVTVLASDGALADAVATALANRVRGPGDVERALEAAAGVRGVRGAVVTVDGHVGAWGDVHLVPVDQPAL